MSNLSVTIISRNEAENIQSCLDSVGWASDIVLVDQFSTDGTAEIAQRLGARVFQEEWKGYAAQKNSAIDKAKNLWILSVDADERVTPPLKQEIEEVIEGEHGYNGFYIARKNFFCGKWIRHCGWYPDYNLRLFRKDAGRFEERAVHEKAVVDGHVGTMRNPLEHYTYASTGDYIQRMNLYADLSAEELEKTGKRTAWHHLMLRPVFTFFRMYGLRMGFLDGWAGLFLSISYAYYTFLKYIKLREKVKGW